MINVSKEQLKELDGIYQMSHKCKDPETKKLAKGILKTIDFSNNLKNFSIETGWFYYHERDLVTNRGIGTPEFVLGNQEELLNLPIVVILYLITKNENYLKPSRYVRGSIHYGKENREYIKFSNTCYLIDKIYGCINSSEFFQIENN